MAMANIHYHYWADLLIGVALWRIVVQKNCLSRRSSAIFNEDFFDAVAVASIII